ncbi:MAG: RNA-binding transcriptional accessory protein [Actinobacteria bacterium]|nr:RNA-binding transcriptional accessory protein [Actinomycetota bacterium]
MPVTDYSKKISQELSLAEWQVQNTIKLLKEDATVPFISRYRKEATGELDEVSVTAVRDRLAKLVEIDNRRAYILNEIKSQGKLTEELEHEIEISETLTRLEDLYLPYKPKKKTRAAIAREKGLEELAIFIMRQTGENPRAYAEKFLNDKVHNVEEALQGARDIISEWINEDSAARDEIRMIFSRGAVLESRAAPEKEEQGAKYRDYFEFAEPLSCCPSHRLLAIRRGENEGFLKVSIRVEEDTALRALESIFLSTGTDINEKDLPDGIICSRSHVKTSIEDSFKRLISPSIENEFAKSSKEKADSEAIKVFAANLRQLLLAPYLGQKIVLALDPGFRTGCKLVVLDSQGDLIFHDTIYPNQPQGDIDKSAKTVAGLICKYNVQAIAIGNGTASRETREFVESIDFAAECKKEIQVFVVSENGASIYSASEAAREEFPDLDVTVRGSISIGRRLMDPLAELVKIDPKNLGVGQYQHDVDQGMLKDSLENVVESCVNSVGVNLNTASRHLLTYISGLGPVLAGNIVNYRSSNGPFKSRQDLLNVARMGSKAYEQCAGFLRITDGQNPLDNTAVHPESYYIVKRIADDIKTEVKELLKNREMILKIKPEKYIDDKAGLPTIKDIINELLKPGRDPRKSISVFEFKKDVKTIEDLKPGMVLPGIITNITNFGAFVDIGVKQDGLVHVSNIANEFVKNPAERLSLNQEIHVKVLEVDTQRKRIQLSIKDA